MVGVGGEAVAEAVAEEVVSAQISKLKCEGMGRDSNLGSLG